MSSSDEEIKAENLKVKKENSYTYWDNKDKSK